jgi:large repetitive protein
MAIEKAHVRLHPGLCSLVFACMSILVLLVLWGTVDGAASSAMMPDSLGPTIDLSGNVIWTGASEAQVGPSLVWSGSNFFAVWTDYRRGEADIYGARIAPDGSVLDSLGIPICVEADDTQLPAVAFDGTNFLVVWQQYTLAGNYTRIRGIRVSQTGTILDPSSFLIADLQDRPGGFPAVAFDGTNYLVTYLDARCDSYDPYGFCLSWLYEIRGAFVSQSGAVLGAVPIYASNSYLSQDVSFDGTNYFVVWTETNKVCGQFVNTSGSVVGSTVTMSTAANQGGRPSVCFLSSYNYLVVWWDIRNGQQDVFGARVTPGRVVLEPGGFAISTAAGRQFNAVSCATDSSYLVSWSDEREAPAWYTYSARVNSSGTVMDTSGIRMFRCGSSVTCDVASNDTLGLVTWDGNSGSEGGQSNIQGARVDTSGAVLDPSAFLITKGANSETDVATAFDGTHYLMVWKDSRGDSVPDIYGAFIDPDGTLLDPSGISIGTTSGSQSTPDVAFDGSNYAVVWTNTAKGNTYADILCTRVTPAGVQLDTPAINVTNSGSIHEYAPAIAYGTGNYLIAWGAWSGVRATRLSPEGLVLDPSGIAIGTSGSGSPDVSFDGDNYIVVYSTGPYYNTDIYAKRVSPAGVVLDPTPIYVCTASYNQISPAVALGDTTWLAVWKDARGGIYGARVTSGGLVLDPSGIAISTATTSTGGPDVCFDGTNFLVTWSDKRSGVDHDVYCARVSTSGTVLDPAGLVASNASGDQTQPALCSTGTQGALVVYSSFIGDVQSYRIWGNLWTIEVVGVAGQTRPESQAPKLALPVPSVFSGVTEISFVLPRAAQVSVHIYDVSGRMVRALAQGNWPEGTTTVRWDGTDERGTPLSSGVYICRLEAGDFVGTRKMVLLQ